MSDPARLPLLYRVARKAGVLRRVNVTPSVTAGGATFRVPVRAGLGFGNLAGAGFDAWKRPLLAAAFSKPGLILDVGANVGQTLLGVRALDPGRVYVGCEPNPPCAAVLEELVALNAFADAHVVPAGLSGGAGLLALHDHGEYSAIASTVAGFRPDSFYTRTRHVAVLRGDDVLRSLDLGPVAAIKIDVEGGELDVVKGLPETLSAHAPPVFCEILPVLEPGHDTAELHAFRTARQEELLRILHGHGYAAFRTPHDGGLEELPAGGDGVPTIGPHGDLARCDYLFLPPDRVDEFRDAAASRA